MLSYNGHATYDPLHDDMASSISMIAYDTVLYCRPH